MAVRSLKTGTFSRSMLVGNASYTPPAYESIATATGTGSSGTITFSSIPSTFKHLQIRTMSRGSNTGAFVGNFLIRFNSDSGSNYAYHYLGGDGGATVVFGAATQTSGFVIGASSSSVYLADTLGVSVIDILDYGSSTKSKTVRAFAGVENNSSTTKGQATISSSLWTSTNAITSIELIASSSANFTTSSTFALYGIKEF